MEGTQTYQVERTKSHVRNPSQLKRGVKALPRGSLLQMPASSNFHALSGSPYQGVSPEEILRLEKAFAVEGLVRQINELDNEDSE